MDWRTVFDQFEPEPGATPEEVASFPARLAAQLTRDEIDEVRALQAGATHRDPTRWSLPKFQVPATYGDFLQWSNGGWGLTGEREFAFLSMADVRSYLLNYEFPLYLPQIVPFALDGGGIFYAFDARGPLTSGEYPIVAVPSGSLFFDDLKPIADSFLACCQGREAIADL